MEEERLMILKMVEEGRITSAEAAELLRAIEDQYREEYLEPENDGDTREPDAGGMGGQFSRRAGDWAEGITRKAGELAERVERGVGSQVEQHMGRIPDLVEGLLERIDISALTGLFGPHHRFEDEITGSFAQGAGKVSVVAQTFNGRIEVQGWDQPGYKVVLVKTVRGRNDRAAEEMARHMASVTQEDARLVVTADKRPEAGGMSIRIHLPKEPRYQLELRTSNGRVTVDDLAGEQLEVITSNGRITADGARFDRAVLNTSNGRIEVKGGSGGVQAVTSNGRISLSLDDFGPGEDAAPLEASYRLTTSNGSVRVNTGGAGDTGYRVDAASTLGGIDLNLPDLVFELDERRGRTRRAVVAQTRGYQDKARRVQIHTRTSNGRVRIGPDVDL